MTVEEAIEILDNEYKRIELQIMSLKGTIKENTESFRYRIDVKESLKTAITALKEIQQYREIGTVEECREAVEKQKAKKTKEILRHRGGFKMHHCPNCDTHYQTDNRYTIKDNYCPACRKLLDSAFRKYCGNCGQAIAENLEGTEDENT